MTSVDEVIRRQTTFDPSRLELGRETPTMLAVVTTGNGGLDKLEYREVRRPGPGDGEVLVRVLAAGVNATEINTRVGWYSAAVEAGTGRDAETQEEAGGPASGRRLGRSDALPLHPGHRLLRPRRRASDPAATGACSGAGCSSARACARGASPRSRTVWLGSDFDGAFAQYVWVAGVRGLPRRERASATPSSARSRARTGPRRTCCTRAGVCRRAARARHRRLRRRGLGRRTARAAARRRGHGGRRRRQGGAGAGARRRPGRGPGRRHRRGPRRAVGRRRRRQRLRTRASTALLAALAAAAPTSRPAPSPDRGSASTSASSTCATSG